jgi:hypothetical protein
MGSSAALLPSRRMICALQQGIRKWPRKQGHFPRSERSRSVAAALTPNHDLDLSSSREDGPLYAIGSRLAGYFHYFRLPRSLLLSKHANSPDKGQRPLQPKTRSHTGPQTRSCARAAENALVWSRRMSLRRAERRQTASERHHRLVTADRVVRPIFRWRHSTTFAFRNDCRPSQRIQLRP